MKWAVLLVLAVLVACAPPAMPEEKSMVKEPVEPKVVAKEQVTSPPQEPLQQDMVDKVVVPPTPVETVEYDIDPYTTLGCEQLLTEDEFAAECGKSANLLVVTYRTGTRNCFVNVKDRENKRLTAGITLTGYDSAEKAMGEFERRLKVLMVGADDSVGERAYVFPAKLADREELEFVRGEFIVKGGTDTRLCSEEGLLSVMRIVDSRIR